MIGNKVYKIIRFYNKGLLILFMLFCVVFKNYAQEEPPKPCSDPSCLHPEMPIDGGIIYLIVAGVIYGYFKLIKKE